MKKLLLLFLFTFFLFGCDSPTAVKIIKVTEDPPTTEEDPPEGENAIILALYDGLDLKFFDGNFFNAPYSGEIHYAGNKIMSVDDMLYSLDEVGDISSSKRLITTPTEIFVNKTETKAKSIVYQDEIWIIKTITPEIADSLGGGRKPYTHIFKDNIEIAPWYTYQFELKTVYHYSENNVFIILDTTGKLHNLTDSKVPFKLFEDLFIYDLSGRTAYMNDTMISFQENYFYTARWNKTGDKFYSNYGMIFSSDGFFENATALQDFKSINYPYAIPYLPNGERPSLHPAGQNYEHSEFVSYFIESTSGHLIRYIPSIDNYEILPKIYQGPNIMSTGNIEAENLKPQWIDGKMYFHQGGSIKVYDPEIGSVNVFADDMELWKW